MSTAPTCWPGTSRSATPVALDVSAAPGALTVNTISAMRLLDPSVVAAGPRLTARVSFSDLGSLRERRTVEGASLIEHALVKKAGRCGSPLMALLTSGQ